MPNGFLNFSLSVNGRVEFERRFDGRIDRLSNLRPFFEQLADDFGDMEREAFRHEGAYEGQPKWEKLDDGYRQWKERHYGVSSILARTGELMGQAVHPARTITDTQLRLLIDVPYAIYHQEAREPRKRRPVVSLSVARKRRWQRLLRTYLLAK